MAAFGLICNLTMFESFFMGSIFTTKHIEKLNIVCMRCAVMFCVPCLMFSFFCRFDCLSIKFYVKIFVSFNG